MAKRSNKTRGRLSTIDLLPDEAVPYANAAIAALKERRRTQDDIREELNNHLLSLGLNPISFAAFSRKALQIAAMGANLIQAREIAAVMAEKLNDAPQGNVGLLLVETLKALVYDVIMNQSLSDGDASIDMLRKSADAIMRLERARKMNVETEAKRAKEFVGKADEAVVRAGKQAGLSKDQVSQIRREVLGVVKK